MNLHTWILTLMTTIALGASGFVFATHDGRMKNMEGRLDLMGSRANAVEVEVGKLGTKIDNIERGQSRVETKIDGIERAIRDLASRRR